MITAMVRIRELLQTGQPGQTVTVQGWVRSRREAKGFTFVDVNDGSSLAGLQAVIGADLPEYDRRVKDLTTGAAVTLVGELVASPGQGQRVELQARELTVVGVAPADTYPLQKKRHSFEFLRGLGHLRSLAAGIGQRPPD